MCDGETATIHVGTLVRIKTDPGRIGVVGTRTRELGGGIWQQVRFPDGSQYLRPSQLEEVGDDEDPLDLLAAGKFGRSKDLRTLLTHIRLSGRLANLIYSMETTNTDFYPYQFKPVLNFLDSPSGGLLIADEVGLGKTIEAGLIWTELRSRFDSRKLLILCPAVLREKWREELHYRFGIDAEILTAEETWKRLSEVREGRRAQVHMIGSLQGLSPRRGWSDEQSPSDGRGKLARLISAAQYDEPMLDLVVIDEAHYMRNPETMSAALGRLLRGVTEHIVLLSATPVHLRSSDLYQLLNLVDEDTFNDPRVFDEILEANAPLLEARDLVQSSRENTSDIEALLSKAAEHPFLKSNRQLAEIRHSFRELDLHKADTRARLANRLERLNLLGHAVTRTRKREVTEWRVVREAVAETVTLHPAERQFYDRITGLVRDYCERREAHEGFLLVTPQRQVSSSMAAALQDWQRRAELGRDDLEDYLERDDEPTMHFGPVVGELLLHAREMGDLQELYAVDTKYRRLASMLTEYLTEHPGEKIILFSTFKATLRYLNERLSQDGIKSMLLMGGMGMNKHEAIRSFHEIPRSCILLASEVASEGVDLQFARVLVNYDLPWNPMKVEQRIGRIDRIGQNSPKITIWNMLHDETIDQRIHSRLYQRLGIFERALGGLEAVLGDEVRKLTMDLMRSAITPQQEAKRIEQTVNAVAIVQNMEADLENKAANLVAHGEYILNQVSAARQMNRWITGEDLTAYVLDYFNTHYRGSTFHQKRPDALTFDIRLDEQARYDLEQFTSRNRLQGVTSLATNAAGPVECEFKNRVSATKGTRTEVISQFHPLVRFVSQGIREKGERFHANVSTRISRTLVPSVAVGRYVFVVDHWSLKGLRDIERINFVVASLDAPFQGLDGDSSELVISQAALHGSDWLAAGISLDLGVARQVTEVCLQRSIEDYDQFVSQMVDENNDRADLQSESLKKYSDRQLNQLRRIRELHKTLGRDNLVRATEGRISKLEERIARKSKDIQGRRGLVHNRREVCVGVIEVG